MKTNTAPPNYKGYRFPPEIISHAVWLYFRFSLSYRDVEELMAQRGIVLTYETIRQWCLKFGQPSANELRRRRPCCGDTWHLDEMVLTIRSQKHYLWRAVDQDGNVLDILVQSRRNKKAAKRFFRKLLQGLQSVPRVIIPDKLRSYGAAKREILPGVEHRQHKRREYPGRELAPAHTTAREENATLQIGRPCPALSFSIWSHLQSLSTAKAPIMCKGVPCHFTGPIPGVG
jgi:putative transposase